MLYIYQPIFKVHVGGLHNINRPNFNKVQQDKS